MIQHFYLGAGYPRSTFLFYPGDHLNDFLRTWRGAEKLDAYTSELKSVYPPLLLLALYGMHPLGHSLAMALLLGSFLPALFLFAYRLVDFLPRPERISSAFTIVFLAYPILFCIDRGNLESVAVTLIALAMLQISKKKLLSGSLLIGLASALKIFPLAFFGIVLSRGNARALQVGIAFALLLTLASAAAMPGGPIASIIAWILNIDHFTAYYSDSSDARIFNPSIQAFIGTFTSYKSFSLSPIMTLSLLPASLVAILLEKELWKQLFLITASFLLFTQVPYDYRLAYVLIPTGFFLSSQVRNEFDRFYSIAFALLLAPKAYPLPIHNATLGSLLNPLLLLAVCSAICFEGCRDRKWIRTARSLWQPLANIGLVLLSSLLAIGLAEVLFRGYLCVRYYRVSPRDPQAYVVESLNPRLFWLRPSSTFQMSLVESPMERFTVSTNRLGFRDREFEPKVAGNTRVIALGDSFTMGYGVPAEVAFPQVAQAILNKRGQSSIEILNAGTPGYDTVQELHTLRQALLPLTPDVLVLGYYVNDAEGSFNPEIQPPWTVYGASSWWSLEAVRSLLNEWLDPFGKRFSVRKLTYSRDYSLSFSRDLFKWERSRRALDEILEECRKSGIQLGLMIIPDLHSYRTGYPHRLVHESVTNWAKAARVPVVDVLRKLEEQNPSELTVRWDGHPNARGHLLLASAFLELLSETLKKTHEQSR